jgi:hypothetical protein
MGPGHNGSFEWRAAPFFISSCISQSIEILALTPNNRTTFWVGSQLWSEVCIASAVLLWERERTEAIRLALAMGEVVHRAGWFIFASKAFRFFRLFGEVAGRPKGFFRCYSFHTSIPPPFVLL